MMPRSIFRFVIVVAVLAFAACPALAQTIQGTVRLSPNNVPAQEAIVECSGSGCSGIKYTDRQGKFSLYVTSTGSYSITISYGGYKTETRSVTLMDRSQTEHMMIQLKPDPKAAGASTASASVVIDPKVPAPARKEYEDGLKEVNAGNVALAIPHLEKAVSLYPEFLQAHLLLGTAYMDDKKWDKAETSLRRAVELDAKKADGHFALGEMYYQQKKYPEAEKELLAGLQIQDNSWQGHYTLARVYMDTNAFDKAAPQMEKANQLRPDYAEGHFLAGNIYIKTRNAEGALKSFEEYLRLAPKGKFAPQVQNTVTKLKEILKK